jgi:hypothetical protein
LSLDRQLFPFPIGDSPFQVKGSGYLLHMKYVEDHLPGGASAMFHAIHEPKLRAFFEQSFIVSHMVDLLPLVAVGHVCARVAGVSFERFIRTRARHQAEGDLRLFRKLILRIASPEALATRIPAITASYFNFATAEVIEKQPEAITAVMHGVPKIVAPWMTYVCEETVRFMLEYNGVDDLRVRTVLDREGEAHGQEIVALRSILTWGGANPTNSLPPRS